MVPSTSVLSELAQRIVVEHKAVERAARSALDHALAAGKLLIQAKDAVGHGRFEAWLSDNFERDGIRLSARTARAYMQVAKRWPEVEAKRQSTADLSLNEALQLLAPPKPSEPVEPATSRETPRRLREPPEKMAELCRHWWQIQAAYVVLLDVAGDDAESIALSLGIDVADVEKVLDPKPANRADEFLFRAAPRLLPCYQATLESLIACQFTTAYGNAAHHAHREGLPELAPALEALDRQAWRKWRALDERSGLSLDFWHDFTDRTAVAFARYLPEALFNGCAGRVADCDAAIWAGLSNCAITDFRVALGIQPHAERSFQEMFTAGADAFLCGVCST